MSQKVGLSGKIAQFFIDSKLTPVIIIAAILLGAAAVIALPREEEPQIIVPMIDIFVQMPGASSKEVEQRVTSPMEKLVVGGRRPGGRVTFTPTSTARAWRVVVVSVFVGEDGKGRLSGSSRS